jgi:hypothetical protein
MRVKGRFATAHLLSPDILPQTIPVHSDDQFTYLQVPTLQIYDLVVLEP